MNRFVYSENPKTKKYHKYTQSLVIQSSILGVRQQADNVLEHLWQKKRLPGVDSSLKTNLYL